MQVGTRNISHMLKGRQLEPRCTGLLLERPLRHTAAKWTICCLTTSCRAQSCASISGQRWSMMLGRARTTHFAESDVRHIVGTHLRDLLSYCGMKNEDVNEAAKCVVYNYGLRALPFVQQLIADSMLSWMEHLLSESTTLSVQTSVHFARCSNHVVNVCPSLSKPQRRMWVSLLVRFLHVCKKTPTSVVDDLMMLWQADEDPRSTYTPAHEQLWALSTQRACISFEGFSTASLVALTEQNASQKKWV